MSNSFFNWSSSPSRLVRFDTARASDVNGALDSVETGFDAVELKTNAALKLQPGETAAVISGSGARANKLLSFDASGNPETVYSGTDLETVSNNISSINTVASNIGNIAAMAGAASPSPIVVTAEANVSFSAAPSAAPLVIRIDANREMILFADGTNLHAVVYDDATKTFGASVLVRTEVSTIVAMATLAGADSVLVCSAYSVALNAVLLTVSGTTITVNTAAKATLSNSIFGSQFYGMSSLVQVGSSYVLSYAMNPGGSALRALTISGTSVTIGSQVLTSGTSIAYSPVVQAVDSTTILAVSITGTSTIYASPYTVSGTTLTLGTQASFATASLPGFYGRLSSGRFALSYSNTQYYGAIIDVTGTVATVSTVQLYTSGAPASYFVVSGNQVLLDTGVNYVNVLTDNAGTAVAGTAIPGTSTYSTCGQYMYSTSPYLNSLRRYTISGNNPVMSPVYAPCTNVQVPSRPIYTYGLIRVHGGSLSDGTRVVQSQSNEVDSVVLTGTTGFSFTNNSFQVGLNTPLYSADNAAWLYYSVSSTVLNIRRVVLQ